MKKIAQIVSDDHPQLSKLMTGQSMVGAIKNALAKIDFFVQYQQDCRVTKFSQGIVYISVSTAALATQIRHQAPMFLRSLQENMTNIQFNAIQCKVNSAFSMMKNEPLYQKNQPKMISEKIKNRLMQLSEKMEAQELSEALKKLVR